MAANRAPCEWRLVAVGRDLDYFSSCGPVSLVRVLT